MKILVHSVTGYGAWFAARFSQAGHDVSLYVRDRRYEQVLRGIGLRPIQSINGSSGWDMVVFDMSGHGELAKKLSKNSIVVGDSLIADLLEDDRIAGIEVMEHCGIKVPQWEAFSRVLDAKKYVEKTQKTYVYKPTGSKDDESCALTYVSKSPEDLIKYMNHLSKVAHSNEFILQEVVHGTEVSTEGYFNGYEWFFINNTLEEKKFMDHGLGPNTGCSGNVVWTYANGTRPKIFTDGLGKLTSFLRQKGCRGMIDLNTIATPDGLYGLEFTPRIGYDATATQMALLPPTVDYAQFLYDIGAGKVPENIEYSQKFAASVRLSVPPYPAELRSLGEYAKGVPIELDSQGEGISDLYLYDIHQASNGCLETVGLSGFIGCPISVGDSIYGTFEHVYSRIKEMHIPDVQYRTDLGEKCLKRYAELKEMGYLKPAGFEETKNSLVGANNSKNQKWFDEISNTR